MNELDFSAHFTNNILESCCEIDVAIMGKRFNAKILEMFIEPTIHFSLSSENRFENAMAESEISLSRYLIQNNKSILVGAPGTGKSTIIKYIAYLAASSNLSRIGLECNYLPIIVPLNGFIKFNDSFMEYIFNISKEKDTEQNELRSFLINRLSEGNVLLLLDGLSDLPFSKQEQLLDEISKITGFNPNNRIVITTRTLYTSYKLDNFSTGFIKEFSIEQIESYSSNVFKVIYSNDDLSMKHSLKFVNAIMRNPKIYELSRNPLFLSILVLLFTEEKELPHNRIELFNIYVEDMIASVGFEDDVKNNFSKDGIIRILSFVAYNMVRNSSTSSFVSETILKGYIKNYFMKKMGQDNWDAINKNQVFFDQVIKRLGVFKYDERVLGYTWEQYSVREYLAALYICFDLEEYIDQRKRGRIRYKEVINMLIVDQRWHGILQLVEEYILFINPNICDPLEIVSAIIEKEIPYSEQINTDRIILAGDCLVSTMAFSDIQNATVSSECQKLLVGIVKQSGISVLSRIKSARILSYIGDPRLDSYDIIPELIDIKNGSFVRGAFAEDINRFIEEARRVNLSKEDQWIGNYWEQILRSEISDKKEVFMHRGYRISKYPITNFQYQQFLNDNPNYRIPSWGNDKKGALYTWNIETRTCNDAYRNCPVVLVSWKDANAYCTWLSKKTGRHFRLPTEEEWEYAARGPASNIYPWGDEWIDGYSNTLESDIKDIIPVGCFLEGASYFGLLDCSGQIWEWTSTEDTELWRKAWPIKLKSSDDNKAYIVKGGAWDDISVFARCSARGPNAEDFFEHYIGFRIVEETEE